MQYQSRCNIFNSFDNASPFRYIYKGRLVKISENIAFLFYKEIYMKYLILYYNRYYILGQFTVIKYCLFFRNMLDRYVNDEFRSADRDFSSSRYYYVFSILTDFSFFGNGPDSS